jgi:hypothetical protein
MFKKYLISLSAFTLLVLIGCSNENINPTSSIENNSQVSGVHTMAPQAFPGQTGAPDSGYFRGNKIYYQHINGYNVFEGDIIFADSQITKSPDLAKTNSAIRTTHLWPGSAVYYIINSDLHNQQRVKDAITKWQMNTPLVFLVRTTEQNYIRFQQDANGCSSNSVGMLGGEQLISLADWGTAGIVMHEIGHALNLLHEHSRTDRDNNIIILWNNIDAKCQYDFYTFIQEGFGDGANYGAYDFNSIMHYPCYSLSVADGGCAINPNKPIITRRNGTTWTTNTSTLSNGDLSGVISLYYTRWRDPIRGNTLYAYQFLLNSECLRSSNKKYILYLESNGDLEITNLTSGKTIWHAIGTKNNPVLYAYMQADGNFVAVDMNWKSYWSSNTYNNPGAWLAMQDDGNLVIYSSTGRALWASNTVGK